MPKERIRFSIESLALINPEALWAVFFINPAIALMEWYGKNPFPLDVKCQQISSPLVDSQDEVYIEITWQAETFSDSQRLFQTVQREAIVEYAAVAVAFLLVTEIGNCTITEVTLRGDKTDYFLNDREFMLEISGTEKARQGASRHKQKTAQLLANPYGKEGYVVVCCFSNQTARFSFHAAPERGGTK
jgi:hypothetical protein